MTTARKILIFIILPLYFICTAIILAIAVHYINIDESKYAPLLFVMVGAFMGLTLLLAAFQPLILKFEAKGEAKKYDLDISTVIKQNYYLFECYEGLTLTFDTNGISLNGRIFPYEKSLPVLGINKYSGINIYINFTLTNNFCVTIKLDKYLIQAINQFKIKIVNRSTLDYLLRYPNDAFYQILKYSKIKNINK